MDDVLRHLVIARICQPASKVATVEYLKSYFEEDISLGQIYRYMDKLYSTQRKLLRTLQKSYPQLSKQNRVEPLHLIPNAGSCAHVVLCVEKSTAQQDIGHNIYWSGFFTNP